MRHHGRGLFRLTQNNSLVKAMEGDFHTADIPNKDIAMLEYAVTLTKDPCHVKQSHVAGLRAAGFKDRDILDIAQVVAYYNYVNRLACGLGVELEPYWQEDE